MSEIHVNTLELLERGLIELLHLATRAVRAASSTETRMSVRRQEMLHSNGDRHRVQHSACIQGRFTYPLSGPLAKFATEHRNIVLICSRAMSPGTNMSSKRRPLHRQS